LRFTILFYKKEKHGFWFLEKILLLTLKTACGRMVDADTFQWMVFHTDFSL